MANSKHITKYSGLHLAQLTQEQHDRTCGYWFTVTTCGGTPHTAFATQEGLLRWMDERGLKLTHELVPHGEHSYQPIDGEYEDVSHLSYDEFYGMSGEETRKLSNGSYTLAKISERDGIRQIHYLNPNCKHRPQYDYFETRQRYN